MAGLLQLLRALCSGGGSQLATTVTTRPGSVQAVPDVRVSLLAPGPAVATALTGPVSGILGLQEKLQTATELSHLPWQQQTSSLDSNTGSSPGNPTQQQDPLSNPQQLQQTQQQYTQHLQEQLRLPQPHHSPSHSQQADNSNIDKQQALQEQVYPQQSYPQFACGAAVSLYDTDPVTGVRNGDPIADQYAMITYEGGGAILALVDGVNWGQRPLWAAKAAAYGFLNHVHQELVIKHGGRSVSSTAAFHIMQAAVQSAQQHVIAADGTLTTLVAAVVCRQRRRGGFKVLSVCVGDSPAFVWRAKEQLVEDVTYTPPLHGFHRDPRICPGCLGYAIGDAPDLSNITYSISTVEAGDVVFLTSDGIADNFDPVIRKQASPRTIGEGSNRQPGVSTLSPSTCHAMAVAEMAAVLKDACRQQQQQQQQQDGVLQLSCDPGKKGRRPPAGTCVSSNSKSQQQQRQQEQQQAACADVQLQKRDSNGGAGGFQGAGIPAAAAAPLAPVDGYCLSATAVVESLVAFAKQSTEQQRKVLEDRQTRESLSAQQLADLVAGLPGKMDHASVVAFKIG